MQDLGGYPGFLGFLAVLGALVAVVVFLVNRAGSFLLKAAVRARRLPGFLRPLVLSLGIIVFLGAMMPWSLKHLTQRIDAAQEIEGQPLELYDTKTAGQTLFASKPGLSGVSLYMLPFNKGHGDDYEIKLHLRTSAEAMTDIATATVYAQAVQGRGFFDFSFEPLADSANRSYYFYVETGAVRPPTGGKSNGIALSLREEDAYAKGALYRDHVPQKGDLTFRTYYTLSLADGLRDAFHLERLQSWALQLGPRIQRVMAAAGTNPGILLLIIMPILTLLLALSPFWRMLWGDRFLLLGLSLLPFLLISKPFFSYQLPNQEDTLGLYLPFYQFYQKAILVDQQPPLWNPHLGGGIPMMANPLSWYYYPTAPLFLFFSAESAFLLTVTLHYLFAGVFAFLLGRTLGLPAVASALCAVAYSFNGWTLGKIQTTYGAGHLLSYTWLPLASALVLLAWRERRWYVPAALAGIPLSFMLNTYTRELVFAMIIFAYFTLWVAVASVVRGHWASAAKVIGIALMAVSFTVVFAAPEFLPGLELQSVVSDKVRFGASVGVGWRQRGILLEEIPKWLFYRSEIKLGIIAGTMALFALVPLWRRKGEGRYILFLLGLLLLGFLLALKTPLYDLFMEYFPLFRRAGINPPVFMLIVFAGAMLAGFGGVKLMRLCPKPWLAHGVILLITGLAYAEWAWGTGWAPQDLYRQVTLPEWTTHKIPTLNIGELSDFPHLTLVAGQSSSPNQPVRIGCFGPGYRANHGICSDHVLLATGLGHFVMHLDGGAATHYFADAMIAAGENPILLLRLLALGNVAYVLSTDPLDGFGYPQVLSWALLGQHESTLLEVYLRRPRAQGWDGQIYIHPNPSALPAAFVAPEPYLIVGSKGARKEVILWSLSQSSFPAHEVVFAEEERECLSCHSLDFLRQFRGVILADEKGLGPDPGRAASLLESYRARGGLVLDLRDGDREARLEGWMKQRPPSPPSPQSGRVTFFSPNRWTIQVKAEDDGFLFLSQMHYPGWKVSLNGQPGQLFQTDHVFTGTPLKKGEYQVELWYNPLSFKLGLLVSSVAAIILVLLMIEFQTYRRAWLSVIGGRRGGAEEADSG